MPLTELNFFSVMLTPDNCSISESRVIVYKIIRQKFNTNSYSHSRNCSTKYFRKYHNSINLVTIILENIIVMTSSKSRSVYVDQ